MYAAVSGAAAAQASATAVEVHKHFTLSDFECCSGGIIAAVTHSLLSLKF